jgi:DNA primase
LLEEEQQPDQQQRDPSADGLVPVGDLLPVGDIEQRIDALFAELNGDALRFQELYYSERRYLQDLDAQRRAGYGTALGA